MHLDGFIIYHLTRTIPLEFLHDTQKHSVSVHLHCTYAKLISQHIVCEFSECNLLMIKSGHLSILGYLGTKLWCLAADFQWL